MTDSIPYRIVLTETNYDRFELMKFDFDLEPTAESITAFIRAVKLKQVEPRMKTQTIPSELQQAQFHKFMRKIVGQAFISEVFQRANQSVVVLFIDSKSPDAHVSHLEALEGFYARFGGALEGSVSFGLMDLNLNEHPMLKLRSAPALLLFEKTKKKQPSFFEGNLSPELIKDWLNSQLTHLTIPDNYG